MTDTPAPRSRPTVADVRRFAKRQRKEARKRRNEAYQRMIISHFHYERGRIAGLDEVMAFIGPDAPSEEGRDG